MHMFYVIIMPIYGTKQWDMCIYYTINIYITSLNHIFYSYMMCAASYIHLAPDNIITLHLHCTPVLI